MPKVTRTPGPGAKRLEIAIKNLGNKHTKAGFPEPVKYPDGTPVAYVAAIQELGDGRAIPPRPFMRPTAMRQRTHWQAVAEHGARAVMAGTADSQEAMELLGETAAGDIRQTISGIYQPPLSLTTLRLRKLRQQGVTIGGRIVGEAHRAVNMVGPRPKGDKSADVSGVSTKPLVFDGILIGSVTSTTEDAP